MEVLDAVFAALIIIPIVGLIVSVSSASKEKNKMIS